MNANSVEAYLRDRGVRYLGSDVMEVPSPAEGINPTHPSDFFSFDSFFLAEGSTRRPKSLHISQTRLMRNLVDISVCLASGPGYRKAMIDSAIQASVIT